MMQDASRVKRSVVRRGVGLSFAVAAGLAFAAAAGEAGAQRADRYVMQKDDDATEVRAHSIPIGADLPDVPALQAILRRSRLASEGGVAGPVCPQVVKTLSSANFTGGSYIVEAGFAEQEIAAASFTVPAADFPMRLDLTEMIFATSNATVNTTTKWSIHVWEGTPNTGNEIFTFASDDELIPHIHLPPGTNGVNVQFMIDPSDPEQIIIQDNGSHTFSIGYRIDDHNQQTGNPCSVAPPTCCNAFPTVDTGGLQNATKNWLFGVNCGSFGCPPNGGWAPFSSLNILCKPSGDWNIRVTYTPQGCSPQTGSCCVNGVCSTHTLNDCNQLGGSYLGDGTNCTDNPCPPITGACCINGNCSVKTAADCAAQGGTFSGAGTTCNANTCKGACCVPSTGNCVFATQSNCAAVNGVFQGVGVACGSVVCFPVGACCLPDGSCTGGLSPAQCEALTGIFQGNATNCASVRCPIPIGSCCVGNVCLEEITSDDCVSGFGGTWNGPNSLCGASACTPACTADVSPDPGDGQVNVDDMFEVINHWGPCSGQGCHADVAPAGGDGQINVDDLFIIINNWGPC